MGDVEHRAATRTRQGKSVMFENLVFVVWLAIPVLALVWAQVSLWHRRRVLSQTRRVSTLPVAMHVAPADPAQSQSAIAS